MTIKILFRNFVFTDWLHKNMIGLKNLWMHFSVLILVGGHGALQERLGVIGDGLPTLREDVLDPGDGGERGPGHGLEDGAEGGPGVEPVHFLSSERVREGERGEEREPCTEHSLSPCCPAVQ